MTDDVLQEIKSISGIISLLPPNPKNRRMYVNFFVLATAASRSSAQTFQISISIFQLTCSSKDKPRKAPEDHEVLPPVP